MVSNSCNKYTVSFNCYFYKEDTNLDARRKEPPREPTQNRVEPQQPPPPATDMSPSVVAPEPLELESSKEVITAPKRPADELIESPIEAKKTKTEVTPVLEDDLSEISDDADEILNRDEVGEIFNFFIVGII